MSLPILPPKNIPQGANLPTEPIVLDEKQKALLDQILAHWQKVEDLTEEERFYLSLETLLRFLRATKWNATEAIKRLQATIAWRREWKVDTWTQEYISPEQETGKQLLYGYDLKGRPLWYLRPALQNTEYSPRQLHHMFYFMSLAEWLMPRGVEKVGLMINFKERGPPNLRQAKDALSILQNHYPERLGFAAVINLPWLATGFFTIIKPLLDPVTREKLKFGTAEISPVVAKDQLETQYGGNIDFSVYDHESYWQGEDGIISLAYERKRAAFDKWKELGAKVGLSEWDFKLA